MIDCPRCGFAQPEDRYCANCGVDIEKYSAPKLPLHQALLKNPISYIVLFVFFAGFLVYTAQKTVDFSKTSENALTTDINSVARDSSPENSDSDITNAEVENTSIPPEPEPEPIPETTEQKKQSSQERQKAQTQALKNLHAAAKEKTIIWKENITVGFYEVPTKELDQITKEAEVVSSSSSFSVYSLDSSKETPLGKLFNGPLPTSFNMPDSRSVAIKKDSSLSFNPIFSEAESTEELEYLIKLNMKSAPEKDGMQTSIEGFYLIPRTGAEADSSQFTIDTVMKHNHFILITGFLPKAPVGEEWREELSGTPLNTVFSENYKEGLSEFMILFSAQ